ncbi:hypothetical protein PLICRDRAFT_573478 [Plicaturopsis crispa FD-325 SS-3]|nr:hypothetical protein PLICRDRAFT_573478 [Plicaturopsis crispa FD-325 SS-3]
MPLSPKRNLAVNSPTSSATPTSSKSSAYLPSPPTSSVQSPRVNALASGSASTVASPAGSSSGPSSHTERPPRKFTLAFGRTKDTSVPAMRPAPRPPVPHAHSPDTPPDLGEGSSRSRPSEVSTRPPPNLPPLDPSPQCRPAATIQRPRPLAAIPLPRPRPAAVPTSTPTPAPPRTPQPLAMDIDVPQPQLPPQHRTPPPPQHHPQPQPQPEPQPQTTEGAPQTIAGVPVKAGVKRRLGMGRATVGYPSKKFKPPT